MAQNTYNKSVYSAIMNRWVFGVNSDPNKTSAIFKDGYDDPTYMTFKVEFGEWGASVLDRSIVSNGITEFGLAFNNYDQLPMGLLNCPYKGQDEDSYWQKNAADDYSVFNKTKFYSAFQFLRSRNEDTRAKYLYYFVNGLYEIQHDYPFIFKKVSGLNELEKFDTIAGQRLKTPAKITLECYEGLDLKIRTLFEFYRKAAWDDVYQRWILPENMREFKMIIYVFERRVFQDTEMFSFDDQLHMKMSFGKLNADIPVKAYECMPCEFDIAQSISWGNDYDAGWNESKEETSKLVVTVKNVKTYFKNNLFSDQLSKLYDANGNQNDIQQKIDSIMIYDLVEEMERNNSNVTNVENIEQTSTTPITNLTVNGAKAMFLDKRILLENEEADLNIKSYIWGHSRTRTLTGYEDTTSYHDDAINLVLNARRDFNLSWIEDNERYRGGWTYSLTSAPTYDETKSFWSNLGDNIKNVLTGTRRLILVSGAANLQIIPNCLIDSYYIPPHVYSPIQDSLNPVYNAFKTDPIVSQHHPKYSYKNLQIKDSLNPVQDVSKSSNPIVSQHEMKYYRDRYWVHNKVLNPVDKVTKPTDPIKSENEPEYNYENLQIKDSLNPVQNVKKSSDPIKSENSLKYNYENLQIQDSLNPVKNAKKSSDPIQSKYNSKYNYKNLQIQDSLNPVLDVTKSSDPIISQYNPKHNYKKMQPAREIPEQEFSELSNRIIPPQEYITLDEPREIPSQDYRELDQERKLKEQQYKEINDEREIPKQEFKNIDNERDIPEQEFKNLDKEREINSELMNLLLIARTLPSFKNLTLEDIRNIPEQDLLELKEAEERSIPIYNADKSVLLESVKNIEGSNEKLLELDKDNKTLEEQSLEILKQNKALANFKPIEDSNETTDEKIEKLKKMTSFIKEFVENDEKVKEMFVKNILALKDDIKKTTIKIIDGLPNNDVHIIKNGEKPEDIKSALMSQNDIDQINRNMKYIAIKDSDIEKLSFQTLITLQDELSEEVQKSHATEGLTEVVINNSVATNLSDKKRSMLKNSVIKDTNREKITIY